MKNGSVVNLASFTHHLPGMQYGYRAQKGQVFVAVILGTADKRDPGVFDAERALRKLAWVPRDELDELRELLRDNETIIQQFMPNIGKCFGIDFALLNETLIRTRAVLGAADEELGS